MDYASEKWTDESHYVEERIADTDTFSWSNFDGNISKLIIEDIKKNKEKKLAYHVNAAQRKDLDNVVFAIDDISSELKGYDIHIVASTLLEASGDAIDEHYCFSYRDRLRIPNGSIKLVKIIMDDDDEIHRTKLEKKYGPFNGSLCNVGGAYFKFPKEIAQMIYSTTKEGGWIQSSYTPVVNELLKIAKIKINDSNVSDSLKDFSSNNLLPVTRYQDLRFHYIRKISNK